MSNTEVPNSTRSDEDINILTSLGAQAVQISCRALAATGPSTAGQHVSPFISDFSSLDFSKRPFITRLFAEDTRAVATGTIRMRFVNSSDVIELKDVLYVPSFQRRELSIFHLMDTFSSEIEMGGGQVTMRRNGAVLLSGSSVDHFPMFHLNIVRDGSQVTSGNPSGN